MGPYRALHRDPCIVGSKVVPAPLSLRDSPGNASPANPKPQFLSQVLGSIDNRTFAIGLGNPQQVSSASLTTLAHGTGGYLLLTGQLTPDTDGDSLFPLNDETARSLRRGSCKARAYSGVPRVSVRNSRCSRARGERAGTLAGRAVRRWHELSEGLRSTTRPTSAAG